jgi:hypothetical protein
LEQKEKRNSGLLLIAVVALMLVTFLAYLYFYALPRLTKPRDGRKPAIHRAAIFMDASERVPNDNKNEALT